MLNNVADDNSISTLDALPPVTEAEANAELNRLFPTESSEPISSEPSADSASVTALKSASTGVVPAVGSAAGASVLGEVVKGAAKSALKKFAIGEAMGGGPEDPIADILGVGGAFVGAIGGGIAAYKAQKAVLDKVAPDIEKQAAVNEQAHPIASAIGDIASSLPVFEFAPGKTVEGVGNLVKMARGVPLGKTAEEIAAAKNSVIALATQSGMGVAGSVVSPLIQGQSPDLKSIGISTLTALLFGKSHDYIENTFHALGLPKPPAPEGEKKSESTTEEKPPLENVVENPSKAYDIPDPVKEKLSEIAKRESSVGLENLPPEDHQALNDSIQSYGKDYHKDAATFYAVEKSKADAQKSIDFAKAAAMPHATDIVNHDNIPEGEATELKPALIVNGEPVVGGETHAEVFKNAIKNPDVDIDAAATAMGDDSAHKFVQVDKAGDVIGEPLSRTEAVEPFKKITGEEVSDPKLGLQSQDLQRQKYIESAKLVQRQEAIEKQTATPAPEPPKEVWKSLQGNPDDIASITGEGGGNLTRLQSDESQGKKLSAVFEDLTDPKTAENIIYTDAERNSTDTNKLAAFESPDGSHVMVGQVFTTTTQKGGKAGKGGVREMIHRVKGYDATTGDVVTRNYKELVAEGWKPLASIKADKSTKNSIATYSPDVWAKMSGEMRERVANDKRTAAAMEEHLSAGKEFGLTEQEKNVTHDEGQGVFKQGEETEAPTRLENFTLEHAEAIHDAISADEVESANDVIASIGDHGLALEFEAALRDSGLLETLKESVKKDPERAQKDAQRLAVYLAQKIYDTYSASSKNEQSFPQRLIQALLDESGQSVAGKEPKPIRGSSQGTDLTGKRASVGDQSAIARSAGSAETRTGSAGGGGKPTSGSVDDIAARERDAESADAGAEGVVRNRLPNHANFDPSKPDTLAILSDDELKSLKAKAGRFWDAETKQAEPNKKLIDIAAENWNAYNDELKRRNSEGVISKSRISPAKAVEMFKGVTRSLQDIGVSVRALHESVSGMAKDAAKYEEWKNAKGELGRAISISVSDVHNPSTDNVVALLHEAGHAVFARETPERQAQLHIAIEKATDDVIGLHNFFEKLTGKFKSQAERDAVVQEGRLVEVAARNLVEQGWTPQESSGVIARVVMAMRNLYQRAAMAMMQAMNLPISADRAIAYFETRMKLALSGSKADSIVSFLGGPRVKSVDWNHPDSVAAAKDFMVRNRDQVGTGDFNPMTTQPGSKDIQNPTEEKVPTVVSQGIVHNTMQKVFKAFDEDAGNPEGITGEELFKKFLPDEKIPEAAIAEINSNLTINGHAAIDPATGMDRIASKAMKDEAATRSLSALQRIQGYMDRRRPEAESKLRRSTAQRIKNAEMANAAIEKYTDLHLIASQAELRMQDCLEEARASQEIIEAGGVRDSMLEQSIRELDDQVKGNTLLPKAWKDALDKLAKRLGVDHGRSLSLMLQKLGEMNLDWKNEKTSILAGQISELINDPDLKPLQGSDHDSRALLATAITFAKKNDFYMNLIRLRTAGLASERIAVNEAMSKARENHSSAMAEAKLMEKKAGSLAPLLDKLLTGIDKLKSESHDLVDEANRQSRFIHFHTTATPIIERAMRPLEAQIGFLKNEVRILPVTELPTPASATSRPDKFVTKTLKISDAKNGARLSDELKQNIKQRQEWLDANEGRRDELGEIYNHQEEINEQLKTHLAVNGISIPLREIWLANNFAPTVERLRMVGTAAARKVAIMIEQSNLMTRPDRQRILGLSHQFEERGASAQKVFGIKDYAIFKSSITDAFKDFSSKNKDRRSKFSNQSESNEAAIKAFMDHLRLNENYRDKLSDPRNSKTVEDFFRKTQEINGVLAEISVKYGNKIKDPALKGGFRNPIGSEEAEYSRHLSDEARDMFRQMRGDKVAEGDVEQPGQWMSPMKPDEIAAAHAQDPKALSEALKARFTPNVWDKFVRWIVYKDGASSFSSPQRTDGQTDYARRDNVIKAYSNNKDPIGFAHDLFYMECKENDAYANADLNKFVGDTMHTFQSIFEIMKAASGDEAEMEASGVPVTPGRTLMNARMTDALPKECYAYDDYNRYALPKLVHQSAYHAAFGRNMETYHQTMAYAQHEQQKLVDTYNSIAKQFPNLDGKRLKEAVLNAAKKMTHNGMRVEDGGIPLNVQDLSLAHQRLANLKMADADQKAFFSGNINTKPSAYVLAQLMKGIGSMTVAGPGTAFVAHIIAFEQCIRNFGLGTEGIKALFQTGKNMFSVVLRDSLKCVGHQIGNEGDTLSNIDKHAGVGRIPLTFAEEWRATRVPPGFIKNPIAREIIYVGRAMQAISTRISAFHYLARVLQQANIKTLSDKMQSVVIKGMEHYDAHPEDKNNINFKFTAKQLGLRGVDLDDRAFKYLNFAMSKYGADIKQMVDDAVRRREESNRSGQPFQALTEKDYQRLAQMSLDDFTGESSPTTRTPALVKPDGWIGRLINPMFGWSVQKGYMVARGFRDPDGKASVKAYMTGGLALLGVMPIAMITAYVRSIYDEDIQGKKNNVSDLSTIRGAEWFKHDAAAHGRIITDSEAQYLASKDAFSTMMDNAARVGTFGIAGEVANMFGNQDNSRPLTLDGRLFVVSTIRGFLGAISNMAHQQDLDYQTVVRPLVQNLGGNGFYQYAGIINHTLGLDNAESRTMNRISVNNYLRVAGRQSNLDVRSYAGMMQGSGELHPWSPAIGNMVMAAYANDAKGFNDAKAQAIKILMEEGGYKRDEARAKLLTDYEHKNPLKIVFSSPPSHAEYQKMLSTMDGNGKVATSTAIRLYKHYGEQLATSLGIETKRGEKQFSSVFGRDAKTKTETATFDPTINSMLSRFRPDSSMSLDSLRRRAGM